MVEVFPRRASELRERMDDPGCDPRLLRNTYAQFALVNRFVTGWRRVFRHYLLPRLTRGGTLLDIGCGGGDLCRSLARWAASEGCRLAVTGIDPDPRALAFAAGAPGTADVSFHLATAEDLAAEGRRFDFVVSNHLLHHLTDADLPPFLETSARLTRRLAIHNDLRRSPTAWLAFSLGRPVFRRSFIVDDGLRSIRRSYTPAELRAILPPGWRYRTTTPFRNLAIYEP